MKGEDVAVCACVSLDECLGPRQQRQRIGQIEAHGGKPSKLQMQTLALRVLSADASPCSRAEQVTIEAQARHKAPRTWIVSSIIVLPSHRWQYVYKEGIHLRFCPG